MELVKAIKELAQNRKSKINTLQGKCDAYEQILANGILKEILENASLREKTDRLEQENKNLRIKINEVKNGKDKKNTNTLPRV